MNIEFNKRVLIYVNENDLKQTGGASGYNYNINEGLKNIGVTNYSFLKNVDRNRNWFKSLNDSLIKQILFVLFRIFNYIWLLAKQSSKAKVDLGRYGLIHFHNVKDMYEARTSLENYRGLVVLTSHSPKPFSFEIYEDVISAFERKCFGRMFKKLIIMEEYAFNRADYIIFPCESAEEPYYKKWDKYKSIHEKNAKKYRYLLTGTEKCIARVPLEMYRKEKGIPEYAFVVSYVGRHNKTKGYDSLKRMGSKLLSDPNIYFLIAGKEAPLKGLNAPNWIEIGWTRDPHSLINAANIFVLPNEETYFDLVMLEVLSIGKIVIASRTGGNKFFETIDAPGVMLYSNEKEALELIQKVKSMNSDDIRLLEQSNQNIFETMFSNDVFAQRYVELINDMK